MDDKNDYSVVKALTDNIIKMVDDNKITSTFKINDTDIDHLNKIMKDCKIVENTLNNDYVPEFKFALREDLVNSKEFLPTKGEPYASGWDVRAAQEDRQPLVIQPGQYFKIPLGFRSYCPSGYYYQLHPRSSSFAKKKMHNLIGIIDESWEGYTLFAGQYIPDVNNNDPLVIEFGEKIGQLIFMKNLEVTVSELQNEDIDKLFNERDFTRKNGGFGSTG